MGVIVVDFALHKLIRAAETIGDGLRKSADAARDHIAANAAGIEAEKVLLADMDARIAKLEAASDPHGIMRSMRKLGRGSRGD